MGQLESGPLDQSKMVFAAMRTTPNTDLAGLENKDRFV